MGKSIYYIQLTIFFYASRRGFLALARKAFRRLPRQGSFCSSRRGSFAQSPQGLGTFDRKSTQNSSLGYFATEVVLQRANRKASHATLLGIRRVLANRRTERTFVGEWPSPRRKPPFEGGSALKNRESASWRKQSRCKNDRTGTNKRIEEAQRLQYVPWMLCNQLATEASQP